MQELKGLAEVYMLFSLLHINFLLDEFVSVHQTVRTAGGGDILVVDRLVRDRLEHTLHHGDIRC